MKPGRKYFIINLDEPYAEDIYKVLKKGQMKKSQWPEGDISFEEWVAKTWPDNEEIAPDGIPADAKQRREKKLQRRVERRKGKVKIEKR